MSPDSEMHELMAERGNVHLKLGELDEAERCYRLVLQSAPRHRNALVNLGFVLKELRRFPESVDFIERALDVSPDDADANYLRATLYQAGGKSAQAAIHLEKAVIRRPEFEFAYRELVIALFQLGRIADAIRWCDRALERLPDSAELHFYRSNLHKHAHATDEAIASARMALKLRPGLFAARSSLAQLLTNALQETSGLDGTAQRVQRIAAGYSDLGIAYLSSSELTAAQEAFEKALALAPQVAEYHYNLGTVLRYHEDVEEAIASFDRAIALDGDHAPARWRRVWCTLRHSQSLSRLQRTQESKSSLAWKNSRAGRMALSSGRAVRRFQCSFLFELSGTGQSPVFERYGALCAGPWNTGPTGTAPLRQSSLLRIRAA